MCSVVLMNQVVFFSFFFSLLLKTNETHESSLNRRWNLFYLYIMCSHKVSVLKVDESKKSYALEAPTFHTFLCCGSHKRAVTLNIVCTKRQPTSHSNIYCFSTAVFVKGICPQKATNITLEYLLFFYCSVC